ncbi:hypothetical protein GCM10009092_01560 [Bowmanella denitrificans]|uniref:DUF4386 domain-containing protein n=1 Tax=Bowmanella denitrificans TaxID=366582 RepID=A0ABN0WKW3_9ALTE
MNHNNLFARLSGLSYLVLIVSGLFGMVYVPGVMFDWIDSIQTVSNLHDKSTLFRAGISACLLSFVSFTVLSGLLSKLFFNSSNLGALLLLSFGVMGATALLANTLNYINVATIMMGQPEVNEHTASQILAFASQFSNGFTLIQVITGIWLVIFGWLAYRTRMLPTVICVLLIVSGLVNYVAGFVLKFVFETGDVPIWLSLPGTLGEFSACLWLLIMGAKSQK